MSEKETHIILSTDQLNIGYSSKKEDHIIVKDIQLEIPKGQLIGLIGINGSGKSTLLRTLSGLQPPLSGTIELSKTLITDIHPQLLAQQLSVVLTGQGISKNLTVLELVALGRQPYTNWLGSLTENDNKHIKEALDATDTNLLRDRKCYELSDGQLQRVLIARALAQDTSLIILDEPMTHLDLHHKASVLKLLTHIAHQKQKTVLFATHDIEHALPLCDQMIVLQNGNAIIDSPTSLADQGVFGSLFPSESIRFNKDTGRFFIES